MSLRILIVDDTKFLRLMLTDILTKSGYEVVGQAENGRIGVDLYRELRPDLVIMDITMPEMDGITALKEIRGINPHSVILICSAMSQRDLISKALKAGANQYVMKPFEPERVNEVIEEVMPLIRNAQELTKKEQEEKEAAIERAALEQQQALEKREALERAAREAEQAVSVAQEDPSYVSSPALQEQKTETKQEKNQKQEQAREQKQELARPTPFHLPLEPQGKAYSADSSDQQNPLHTEVSVQAPSGEAMALSNDQGSKEVKHTGSGAYSDAGRALTDSNEGSEAAERAEKSRSAISSAREDEEFGSLLQRDAKQAQAEERDEKRNVELQANEYAFGKGIYESGQRGELTAQEETLTMRAEDWSQPLTTAELEQLLASVEVKDGMEQPLAISTDPLDRQLENGREEASFYTGENKRNLYEAGEPADYDEHRYGHEQSMTESFMSRPDSRPEQAKGGWGAQREQSNANPVNAAAHTPSSAYGEAERDLDQGNARDHWRLDDQRGLRPQPEDLQGAAAEPFAARAQSAAAAANGTTTFHASNVRDEEARRDRQDNQYASGLAQKSRLEQVRNAHEAEEITMTASGQSMLEQEESLASHQTRSPQELELDLKRKKMRNIESSIMCKWNDQLDNQDVNYSVVYNEFDGTIRIDMVTGDDKKESVQLSMDGFSFLIGWLELKGVKIEKYI